MLENIEGFKKLKTHGVHVLIVGVSHYEHVEGGAQETEKGLDSGLGQLNGCAMSAAKFAQWVLDEHHIPDLPLKSLRVLISPSEGEEVPEVIKKILPEDHAASLKNIKSAYKGFLKDSRKDKDGMLIVYMCGHGVQIKKDNAHLLLEDFGHSNHDNILEASTSIQGLRDGIKGKHFPQKQFWFADCCQLPSEQAEDYENLFGGFTPDSRRGEVKSDHLFIATAPLSPAWLEQGKQTVFNNSLMCVLEQYGGSSIQDDYYTIQAGGLSTALQIMINNILERANEGVDEDQKLEQLVQNISVSSLTNFHVYKAPPDLPVLMSLQPGEALPTKATVKAGLGDDAETVFDDRIEGEVNFHLKPGIYVIDCKPNGDFKDYRDLFAIEIKNELLGEMGLLPNELSIEIGLA
ncbi:caspase family protein [Hellea sp.]|nr:caspase family protein [Hellea sp.]